MFNAPREKVSEVDELSNLSELPNSAWYSGVTPRFFSNLKLWPFSLKRQSPKNQKYRFLAQPFTKGSSYTIYVEKIIIFNYDHCMYVGDQKHEKELMLK